METLRFKLTDTGIKRLRSMISALASIAIYAKNRGGRPFGEFEMALLARDGPPEHPQDIYLVIQPGHPTWSSNLVIQPDHTIRSWMWSKERNRFIPIPQVEAQYLVGSAKNDMRIEKGEWETTFLDGAEELPPYETFVFAPAVQSKESESLPTNEGTTPTPFIIPR